MPPNKTIITCKECHAYFSNISNLRAHVKRKHPEKLNILCPKKMYKTVTTCSQCNRAFVKKSNLITHVKHKHTDKLDSLCAKKMNNTVATCTLCNKTFAKRSNLITHMKHKHPDKEIVVSNKTKNLLKCPLCQNEYDCKKTIIDHFKQIHSISMDVDHSEFHGFDEFASWKQKMEKDTQSSYIQSGGSYKTKSCTRIRYTCHRSGQLKQRGAGERHLKIQGSNKINGFCPASMDVCVEGVCKCTFLKTHVGHKPDLRHLFLTDTERRDVAAKIASKVPFQTILDDVRDSVSNCQLERLHLLKKKDLYNIEQCFHLNKSSVRHANDVVTVESWINEMKSSVLFYKPEGTLSDEYPIDEECLRIVKSFSQPVELKTAEELLLEKEKIIAEFSEKVKSVSSVEELNAVKRMIAPIDPTLEAIRHAVNYKNLSLLQGKAAKTPHNKNICTRRFVTTKKIKKNRRKDRLESISTTTATQTLLNIDTNVA